MAEQLNVAEKRPKKSSQWYVATNPGQVSYVSLVNEGEFLKIIGSSGLWGRYLHWKLQRDLVCVVLSNCCCMFKTGRLMCHGIGGKIDTVASRTLAIYACTTTNDNRFLCPSGLANKKKLIVNTNTLTRASPMAPHGALPALHMCNADGDVRATGTLRCLDVQRQPEGCVPWCT